MNEEEPYSSLEITRERERWIARYTGHFGEPPGLSQYRFGSMNFRELYDQGMRFAEMMLAEAQTIHSKAFE